MSAWFKNCGMFSTPGIREDEIKFSLSGIAITYVNHPPIKEAKIEIMDSRCEMYGLIIGAETSRLSICRQPYTEPSNSAPSSRPQRWPTCQESSDDRDLF